MQTKQTVSPPDEREPLELDEPMADKPASSFDNVATSIGSRNLMIIIVTMPLVFIAVVTAMIAVFGGGDEDGEVASAPVETLAEPAPARVVSSSSSNSSAGAVSGALSATPAGISLNTGDYVAAMSLDGDRLALRVDGPEGPSVVIYDLAAGDVVQRIPIIRSAGN